jgi:hypothetical protein
MFLVVQDLGLGGPVELLDHAAHRGAGALLDAPSELRHQLVEDRVERATVGQGAECVLVQSPRGQPTHLEQDLLLARKVEVEGPLGDAGAGGDLLGGRAIDPGLEAPFAPQIERRLDQLSPGLPGAFLRQRRSLGPLVVRAQPHDRSGCGPLGGGSCHGTTPSSAPHRCLRPAVRLYRSWSAVRSGLGHDGPGLGAIQTLRLGPGPDGPPTARAPVLRASVTGRRRGTGPPRRS